MGPDIFMVIQLNQVMDEYIAPSLFLSSLTLLGTDYSHVIIFPSYNNFHYMGRLVFLGKISQKLSKPQNAVHIFRFLHF